jgi:hypothetical protein
LVPGFLASKSLASLVKVALRDAAAKTVMLPESLGVSDPPVVAAEELPEAAGVPEPHPARPAANAAARRNAGGNFIRRSFLWAFR